MSLIFPEHKRELKVNFSSELKAVHCFQDYLVFLYFKSGQYQIWHAYNNQLIISKSLPNDILKFYFFSPTCLLYTRSDGTIQITDVFQKTETEYFSASIPTPLANNYNTSSLVYEVFKQNVILQSSVQVNTEKGIVFVFEKCSFSSVKVNHVVSLFHLEASSQPVYQHPIEHNNPLQFTYFNQSSRLFFWDQFLLEVNKNTTKLSKKKDDKFFYMGEVESERFALNKIEILNNLGSEKSTNSTLMGIFETNNPSELIFYENTNTIPNIRFFNLEEKMFFKVVSFSDGPKYSCISSIFAATPTKTDPYRVISFLEMDSYDTDIRIYMLQTDRKKLSQVQRIGLNDNSIFGADHADGQYCLEIEKGNLIEENPFKDMKLNMKLFQAIKAKRISLLFLLRQNLYHIYTIKMILDFMP